MVAEAEGREWVPSPEPEPEPELLSEAEFHARLDRMVADAEARAAAARQQSWRRHAKPGAPRQPPNQRARNGNRLLRT